VGERLHLSCVAASVAAVRPCLSPAFPSGWLPSRRSLARCSLLASCCLLLAGSLAHTGSLALASWLVQEQEQEQEQEQKQKQKQKQKFKRTAGPKLGAEERSSVRAAGRQLCVVCCQLKCASTGRIINHVRAHFSDRLTFLFPSSLPFFHSVCAPLPLALLLCFSFSFSLCLCVCLSVCVCLLVRCLARSLSLSVSQSQSCARLPQTGPSLRGQSAPVQHWLCCSFFHFSSSHKCTPQPNAHSTHSLLLLLLLLLPRPKLHFCPKLADLLLCPSLAARPSLKSRQAS